MKLQNQNKALMVFAAILILLTTGCAQNTITKEKYSGFLDNYSILKPTGSDSNSLAYTVADVNFSSYHGIIVDDVQIITPTGELENNKALLEGIAASYKATLIEKLQSKNFNVVTQVQANTVRLQPAITSIYSSFDDLRGYQYIPVSAAVTGAIRASGVSKKHVRVMTELKIVDAKNGQLLAEFMDLEAGKEKQSGDAAIKLDEVEPVLEQWAERVVSAFVQIRK